MSDLIKKNPWKDIAPYKTTDAANFKGRDEDIRKFSKILHQNDFSVLYAESGIGKTSFINAGIMPAFINTDYYFIRIEFPLEVLSPTNNVTNEDLANNLEAWLCNKIFPKKISEEYQIVGELFQELTEIESVAPELQHNLWWKLHAYKYQVEDNDVKPFIVFDQFEEVFQKASPVILNELFAILDSLSSRIPPRVVLDRLYEFEEKGIYVSLDSSIDFKVLFSLRKEYLAEFDYWINDVYSNSQLLQSRMILLPFTKAQAEEVIVQQTIDGEPVDTLVDIKDDILALFEQRSLYSTLNTRNKNSYEAFLLSVVCSRLYVIAQSAHKDRLAKVDMVNINLQELILNFYNESIGDSIPKRHLRIIEEELVDNLGERNRIKLTTEKLSAINFKERYLDGLKKKHIVKSSDGYVELIHDRVAEAIYQKRKNDNKKQWFLLQRVILSCIILFFTGISLKWAWSTSFETSYDSREFIRKEWKTPIDYNFEISDPYVESVIIENKKGKSSTIRNCPNLTNVEIENRKSSLDLHIINCPKLHSLSIPNSITELSGRISWCLNLHYIRLPENIKSISKYLFRDLDSLEIEVPESAKNTFRWENKILWNLKSKEIIYAQKNADPWVLFPKELEHLDSLKVNYSRVIRNARNEKPKIEIIGSTIVAVNLYNNDTIDLSDSIYNGIKSIGEKAFYNARILREIKLPPHLKNIEDNAFAGCTSLQQIDFPESLDEIGNGAFVNCTNLTEVMLPNTLSNLGRYAFSGCSRLKRLHLPDSIELESSGFYKGIYTQFEGCDSLSKVSFTERSLFKEKKQNVFYKDMPFIVLSTKNNYDDSSLTMRNDILTHSFRINNSLWSQDIKVMNRKRHVAYLYYKGIQTDRSPIIFYPNSIEYLPLVRNDVTFIGNQKLRELHIANTSPRRFQINLPDIVKSNITLYVPYGCKKYYEIPDFSSFKEIKEDSFFLRIKNILFEMISNSLRQSYVLYFICTFIIIAVFIYIYVFYRKKYLKKYSNTNIRKEVLHGKSLLIACSTLFVFLLTWMSVYWSIYFAFEYRPIWAMIFGHLLGVVGALFSTWILVFVRNADVWIAVKSGFNHLIAKSRALTFREIMILLNLESKKMWNGIILFVKRRYKSIIAMLLMVIIVGIYYHKHQSWSDAIYKTELRLSDDTNKETIRQAESLLYNSIPRWKFLLSKDQQDGVRGIYEGMFDTIPNYKVLNEYTPKGHIGSIQSVAISHNNEHLVVTGSGDDTAIIWDALTGDTIRTLRGHKSNINSVAFSHNDSLVVTGSSDNTAIIWNALTGDTIHTLRGHKGSIYSVAFSHNDSLVITTGSYDDTAIIWDALTGYIIRRIPFNDNIKWASFNRNASQAFIATDEDVYVNNGEKSTKVINAVDKFFNESPITVLESENNPHAYVSNNGNALVWNTLTGETLHSLSIDGYAVYTQDGKYMAYGNQERSPQIYEFSKGNTIPIKGEHKNDIKFMAFSHNGEYLATGSSDSTTIIWSTLSGDSLYTLHGHKDQIETLAFSHDDKYIVTVSKDDTAIIWNILTGDSICSWKSDTNIDIALFTTDNKNVILGSSKNPIYKISNWKTGDSFRIKDTKLSYQVKRFSPDCKYAIGDDGRIFDVNTENMLHKIQCQNVNEIYFASKEGEYYLVFNKAIKKVKLLSLSDWIEICHESLMPVH